MIMSTRAQVQGQNMCMLKYSKTSHMYIGIKLSLSLVLQKQEMHLNVLQIV